jgi:hypothetical protein
MSFINLAAYKLSKPSAEMTEMLLDLLTMFKLLDSYQLLLQGRDMEITTN